MFQNIATHKSVYGNSIDLDYIPLQLLSYYHIAGYYHKKNCRLLKLLILIDNWQDSRLSITPMFHSD